MEVKVRLRLGYMENFGTGSLIGAILNQNPEVPLSSIKNLEIQFEVTSYGWKKINKGPHLTLMPEYVPLCLIEDVLSLARWGIQIKTREIVADPS